MNIRNTELYLKGTTFNTVCSHLLSKGVPTSVKVGETRLFPLVLLQAQDVDMLAELQVCSDCMPTCM